jgi:release factor glutamine methyltransferase
MCQTANCTTNIIGSFLFVKSNNVPYRSIMFTKIQEIQKLASQKLTAAGIETGRLDARCLLAEAMQMAPDAWATLDRKPTEAELSAFDRLLQRRLKREPLAHILGRKEFWSLDFTVNPHSLTPRPDSETLIEAVLAHSPNRQTPLTFLDLGTGSGCLLLSALSEYPNARGLGVDASEEALAVAQDNARRLGFADRCEWQSGDWCGGLKRRFDVVLCNPPYIPEPERKTLMPEVGEYEPETALFAGMDGLDAYRSLVPQLPTVMAENGYAVLECGAAQADAVAEIAIGTGMKVKEIRKDLAGINRAITLIN